MKYYYKLFLALIFSFINYSLSSIAPVIISVEQTNQNTIKLKWATENSSDFKRYRLFYTDNSSAELKELPHQMEKSYLEFDGTIISVSKVNNSNECCIQCIQNLNCSIAEYIKINNVQDSNEANCFLKKYSDDNQINAYNSNENEFYKLKSYSDSKNEASITNLPVNNIYSFQLSVHDGKQWSLNSKPSSPISLEIEMRIKENIIDEIGRISWEQSGKFKNHYISKYTIKIWSDNDEKSQDFVIHENISQSINQFQIPFSLVAYKRYKLLLEYKTKYGVYGKSNLIHFMRVTTTTSTTTTLKPNIRVDFNKTEFKENQNGSLICKIFNTNSNEIIWTKLDSNSSFNGSISKFDSNNNHIISELSLTDLKIEDTGSYVCALKQDLSIFGGIYLTVYGRPAKPKIKNVIIFSSGETFINWNVDHLGNAAHVKNVRIEYESNLIVANKDSYPNEFDKNEITLNTTIPENSQVVIQLETEYGQSDKADFVNAKCGIAENCPGRIKMKNMQEEQTTRIPLGTGTLVSVAKPIIWAIIGAFGAFLFVGLALIVGCKLIKRRKYQNHKPVSNLNDATSNNTEI